LFFSLRAFAFKIRRMNKTLLDTDIYSGILRTVNPTVVNNARSYRQSHGVLTLSVINVMERADSIAPKRTGYTKR
jgi:hypothetical protein